MKLNLGCSDDHKPGYVNVDVAPPADQVADLRFRWPWPDSSVEEIFAHDVFEHLYQKSRYLISPVEALTRSVTPPVGYVREVAPKVWAMNEAHRVLKPGGLLDLWVPCMHLSDGRINPGAFADPTHCSYWTMDDQYYFFEQWNNPQGERGRLGPAYGITALFLPRKWELFEYGAGHERRSKIRALLEAVK